MASDAIYLRAGELLSYAAGLLDGIDRAYVAPATPALDCPDQLTVHVNALSRQPTFAAAPLLDYAQGLAVQTAAVTTVSFVLTLVRCTPKPAGDGSTPSTLDYEAASLELLSDIWTLWHGVPAGVRDGLLWSGCEQLVLGPASPMAESGGMAGWQLGIQAEVFDG